MVKVICMNGDIKLFYDRIEVRFRRCYCCHQTNCFWFSAMCVLQSSGMISSMLSLSLITRSMLPRNAVCRLMHRFCTFALYNKYHSTYVVLLICWQWCSLCCKVYRIIHLC